MGEAGLFRGLVPDLVVYTKQSIRVLKKLCQEGREEGWGEMLVAPEA